jgi:hypothetical protein
LLQLAAAIERSLRELALQLGVAGLDTSRSSARLIFQALVKRGVFPAGAASSFDDFWAVRNQLVHGRDIEEFTAGGLLQFGISLLRLIKSVPHETYRVIDVVPVYADAAALLEAKGLKGVVLEVHTPDGQVQRRIYPVTRLYTPGSRVGWAWNMERVYPQMFYRDDSDEIRQAWLSAGEFTGPEIPEAI